MKNIILNNSKYRILIIGANGMIGHTLFNYFSKQTHLETVGLIRELISNFDNKTNIIEEKNFTNPDILKTIIDYTSPNLLINCVGIVKQNPKIIDIEHSLYLNSIFPKLLNQICKNKKIRFLTFSTDCIFSGQKGLYKEDDLADAKDSYGMTKYLGEINEDNDSITLRTSFIGKEINTKRGLLEWILSESKLSKTIYGFKNAIYSGLPTVEIARIINEYIIPNVSLKGLYHLSSEPIDKYTLLNLIKETYSLDININENYDRFIDRSLNSSKFRAATGFKPLSWKELVKRMYENNL